MMEIKTGHNIELELNDQTDNNRMRNLLDKKWVAVDDINKYLNRLKNELSCRIEHGANREQIINSVDTIFKKGEQ